MRAKTVVIGGGVMGVNVAMHVARRSDPLKDPVLLLERSELAAGSSGRSGAILRQFYSDRVVAAMARDSLRRYTTFHQRTGRSVGFVASGVLTLAGPAHPDQVELIRKNAAMMQSIGVDVRVVEDEEINALSPGIQIDDGTIGAYEAGGGMVDPVATVEAIAALARNYGATTRTGTPVTEIHVAGGRVHGVQTAAGPIESEQVVIAAGPWAHRMLREAGVELPLRVVRPEQAFLSMPLREIDFEEPSFALSAEPDLGETRFLPAEDLGPPPPHPVLLDLEHGYYAKCEPRDQRTRIGRMDYGQDRELADPDDLDEAVDDEFLGEARHALRKRVPVYGDEDALGGQAAWYTLTPDGQAVLGPVPGIEGLFVAAGFSGHGFKLGPSIGEGMAQILAGEPVSAFDPEFFAPDRFTRESATPQRRFGL